VDGIFNKPGWVALEHAVKFAKGPPYAQDWPESLLHRARAQVMKQLSHPTRVVAPAPRSRGFLFL
jgi:hypothetical protein